MTLNLSLSSQLAITIQQKHNVVDSYNNDSDTKQKEWNLIKSQSCGKASTTGSEEISKTHNLNEINRNFFSIHD